MACIGLYRFSLLRSGAAYPRTGDTHGPWCAKARPDAAGGRRGLLLALAGTVIGTGAAMAVTRLMSATLYNVRPYDPATFAGVCILLVLVALVACSIPARRAISIDPMIALRDE